jgi:hypothetical protein
MINLLREKKMEMTTLERLSIAEDNIRFWIGMGIILSTMILFFTMVVCTIILCYKIDSAKAELKEQILSIPPSTVCIGEQMGKKDLERVEIQILKGAKK